MSHAARVPGDIETLRAIASSRHGVVSRDEALAAGFSYNAINRRISSGLWARSGRALIIRDTHRPSDRRTAWTLHLHTGPASLVSGPLALRLQGWDVRGDDHIVVNPHDVRADIDLDLKIMRRASDRSLQLPDTPPLVPRLGALVDTLICRSERAARDLLDHALQQRWINALELDLAIAERSGPGRRGQRRLHELRDRAASGSRSEAEQRMSRLLARTGGDWIPNFAIRDENGQVLAEIDFADPGLKIAIEVDGRAFHSDRRSFERDRERQNMLVLRGWIVLRFTWERMVNDPEGVIIEVTSVITGRTLT